ncbi:DUF4181 domain-containing protein [Oceanobacillus timonensis]|uniref:DUF4181 domain-containing protein n=1 Tax=Oceanobacillus timonensis TaxID=1926285 RepID=UPI0009B9DE63|nr:DUF4181 domain-containing protein [Oceanobacillus timonensis]
MIRILTMIIVILILDHFINRYLIKKWDIQTSDLGLKYVNKLHKYGERILYLGSLIVLVIAVNDFPDLRIWVFISMAVLFAFRTIMKWTYAKENKTYLLNAVTCGLFIVSSFVYGFL